MLIGGNGAGKSTFYEQFLKPKGLPFVNADIIAREYFSEEAEARSLEASQMVEVLRYQLLAARKSFCFETVFSHKSKIDFIGDAKAAGYEITVVFIHLDNPELNVARVAQRVDSGGHSVPEERIAPRIERLLQQVQHIITLGLVDDLHIVDNSNYTDPFIRLVSIKNGVLTHHREPLPQWVKWLIGDNE